MKLRPSRTILLWIVVLTATTLLGGFYSDRVQATTRAVEVGVDLDQSLKIFTELLGMVEENHATAVDADTAVYGAIDGMLRTLDPHSRFFSPKDFTQLREDQRGRYFGLGITVSLRFGKVYVVSPPFPGAPAEKAGLRVGDVISHVNGQPTEADLTAVVGKLKGPKGTPVDITIVRPGVDEPLEITIVRDEIAKFTINKAFEISEGVGYIKIENFAETTGTELRDKLRTLDSDNLDGLILDLRGNPGGCSSRLLTSEKRFCRKTS